MSRSVPLPRHALAVLLGVGLIAASFTLNPPSAAAAIPIPVIASIAAGGYHTCALTTAGGVMCWGGNGAGQLGDGTETDSAVPVNVTGLTSGVAAISAGSGHTCALTTAGGMKCWGGNFDGQLGIGTTTTTGCDCVATPVDVTGLTSGVAAISAGQAHTCALTTAGGMKCWGDNFEGELGIGSATTTGCDCITAPVDVLGLTSGVSAISAGGAHTCALTTAGGMKCWGANFHGAVGDGTTNGIVGVPTPADVSGLTSGVSAISAGAGDSTCAVTTAGGAKCWGFGVYGQLGDGAEDDLNPTPVDVSGLTSGVTSISGGVYQACALTTAGGVKCWGGNDDGQVGDGTNSQRDTPVDVTGLTSGVAAISAGSFHTCALTTSGVVKCWGDNVRGELGDGSTKNSPLRVHVFGPTVSNIESSLSGAKPVSSDGDLWVTTTWGGNDPYGAITSYQAQMQVDAGAWSDVPLAKAKATGFTMELAPGSRYNFQIRVTDSSGRSSVWSPEAAFNLNAAQESSASYAGTWAIRSLPGYWGGAVESSTELNASASLVIHGSRVAWVGTKGPAYGSADVYMDGTFVTTIDCNAGSTMKRQILFSSGPLSKGRHTIEIVNLATAGHPQIDVDGFVSFG